MDISLKDMTAVGYNGTDLSKVTYNGATVWQKQAADKRTVRFARNNATLGTLEVDNGTSILETADSLPTFGITDFSGWFLDGYPYDFDTLVTEDTTLVASNNASAHDAMVSPSIRTLHSVELNGKVVFLRVDFNMHNAFATNMAEHAQTIQYILNAGGKLVIASGRGNFSAASSDPAKYDLGSYVSNMSNYFRTSVFFLADPTNETEYQKAVAFLSNGQILLLQNMDLFSDVERRQNQNFAQQLAAPVNVYVNDCTSTALVRAYTSVVTVPQYVNAVAVGFAGYEAYATAYNIFNGKNRPMTAIVGGDSGDFMIVNGLIGMYDTICLTGGLACLFLAAQGYPVNEQTYNPDYLNAAREILNNSLGNIMLPYDLKVTPDLSALYPYNVVERDQLTAEQWPIDIGTLTEQRIYEQIRKSATVLAWHATGELRGGATYIMQGLANTDTPLEKVITVSMSSVTKLLGIEDRFPMDLTPGAWSQYVESGGTSIPAGIQVIQNKN